MAVVYLLAAPTGWWRRVWQTFLMGVAVLVAAGWWVAIVALTPAADRPYVGGSQNNSILNLIFGYNGFGRLDGSESGSVGGGRVAGSMWGPTGFTRLFNAEFGNMMSWLLPGALVMGAVLLVVTIRARRTDRERAGLLLWGGSLVSIGLVISLAQGIIHPYYTVALAPPLGALVGIGTMGLWQRRAQLGRASRPGRGLGGDGGLELHPPRAHLGLVPRVAAVRGRGRRARRGGHPAAPAPAQRPEARHRRGGGARSRRRAGRAALLDRGHRGDGAQRGDPISDADRVRRLRRPRWWLRRRCRRVPGRWCPPGLRRRRVPRWDAGRSLPRVRGAAFRTGAGTGRGTGGFPGGARAFGGGGSSLEVARRRCGAAVPGS